MRVAVVTETWPPEINGVAMSIARVVRGLQGLGHEVQLVRPAQAVDRESRIGDEARADGEPCPDDGAPAADARLSTVLTRGLPIPRYPTLRLGVPAGRLLGAAWTRHRPDVVHLATEGPLGWSALRAALRLGVPVSSDFRTNFHAYSDHYGVGWLRRPIAAYLKGFHNRACLTMVPTEALRRELTGHGFLNLEVVARGVDVDRFSPALRDPRLRERWGAGAPDDLVVACVGRLAPEKNLHAVLGAFAAIRRTAPGARLVLVGDGPMRAALAAACPDAVLAGQRSGADLAAHYASADLFLFASLTETFGNVTAEAMASGLPVVAFDYAAAAQLIRDGETGRLAPFGDGAAFEAAALALARDAQARRRIGAAARTAVAPLGWDRVVGRFEALLREAAFAAPRDAPLGARHRTDT